MKKLLHTATTFIGLATISIFLMPSVALAQYGPYGNAPVTQISLNKTVKDPISGNFVKNLGVNNKTFQSGDQVVYHLDITNNGNTSFGFVDVTDTLPAYLSFLSGPGTYNQGNRQLKFRIDNLTPGSTQTREIVAQVVPKGQLPSDNAEFCIVNAASLQTNTGQTASDTAQVCIGKKVPGTPVKQLPATGSQEVALGLFFLTTLGLGIVLKKAKY